MAENDLKQYVLDEFYWLHAHPELSGEEFATTERLKAALSLHGIRILDSPLQTGLVAELGSGAPVVALRADVDALPIEEQTDLPYRSSAKGKMHACGHDFHMAAVLGAACLLKAQENNLCGTARIVFQPAEEAPGGAKDVLETGALEDAALIFGLHSSSRLPVGTIGLREGAVTASVDAFRIIFRGQGTHAAHPDGGRDPIVAAAAFIGAVQNIVTKNTNPTTANLISVTHIEAGNTWNVIPGELLLEGTARSLSNADRKTIRDRLYGMAEGIAAAYDVEIETDWHEGPPATANDAVWTSFASEVARDSGFSVVPAPESLAGEDFAFYQEKLPGVFALVGTGLAPANHTAGFRVDPDAIWPAAEYLSELVRRAVERLAAAASSREGA